MNEEAGGDGVSTSAVEVTRSTRAIYLRMLLSPHLAVGVLHVVVCYLCLASARSDDWRPDVETLLDVPALWTGVSGPLSSGVQGQGRLARGGFLGGRVHVSEGRWVQVS